MCLEGGFVVWDEGVDLDGGESIGFSPADSGCWMSALLLPACSPLRGDGSTGSAPPNSGWLLSTSWSFGDEPEDDVFLCLLLDATSFRGEHTNMLKTAFAGLRLGAMS